MSADLLARLIEAGTPAALVAEVAAALGRAEVAQATVDALRASNRERQRRHRANKPAAVTPVTLHNVSNVTQPPLMVPSLPPDPLPTPLNPPTTQVARERAPESRGSFLAEDWQPSEAAMAVAVEAIGEERAAAELIQFRDFWRAKAGADGRKRDWDATWRNWARNEAKRGRGPPGGSASSKAANANGYRRHERPPSGHDQALAALAAYVRNAEDVDRRNGAGSPRSGDELDLGNAHGASGLRLDLQAFPGRRN